MMRSVRKLVLALATVALMAGPAFAVDLTMYYPVSVGGPITKVIDGMIADFEKENPDIHVKAIYAGNYDDTRVKALAALRAGEPVQLSVLFSIDLFELMDQDVVVPFDDVVTSDADQQWLQSFYPALMENSSASGKVWGVPFQRSTIVMYYNKDAFREAGLDPNTPPQTWDEMVEMGKKLTKRDASGKVVRWGLHIPSTGYPYWMFGALCMQNDQVLMNGDGNTTYFDNPAVVEAMTFWRDLGGKYGIMPEGTINWGTLRQKFLEGSTAMMWHSTGNLTPVRESAPFDFGVAMLPAKKRPGSPTGGGNFYIFKKTTPEERTACLTFVKWMTAPERSAKWSMATGYIGTSHDAYATEALTTYCNDFPAAAVARDQLDYATAELSTYENARVKKLLDDAIQAVLSGQDKPEAAMAAAQKGAERILKRYR
ncbi:sn-glycerol 3-phosphate transport system substrate-binding protein [Desulfobaculum xiamenense]|uniref:sn-glycerol 3-phosphate transport system substrate-binding protein n=1 Tax=Desulfobaculum xiamenense TaxID=995050 RepID=A0A846QJ93_9BACT|nr:ABC transporter substrate-binding protein [Desulfobaculum xiamenense]NJB67140.1 sn-glycerol 3-phosphate transport system substrate-binding protein [Desulfobaculum xiamenense]